MNKKIEVVIVFSFLLLFSFATIYPVVNIIGVSLRTDNAFQSQSLSLYNFQEDFIDSNNNEIWDFGEEYIDLV